MLYVLHHEDDHERPGEIHQANKLYVDDLKEYDDLLAEMGHKHIKMNAPGLVPPEKFYVDLKTQTLTNRPIMPIDVSKARIKAGAKDDSAVLKNCPAGAKFEIITGGVSVFLGLLDGTELELYIPVPCIYRVTLDFWPYQKFTVEIEAA
jgi:hypothetical protein